MNAWTALKLIGIVSMTLDHIGAIILPDVLWFRIVGRWALPIFVVICGVSASRLSRDPMRYAGRLLSWAVVAQPIYALCFPWRADVLFTLAGGVAASVLLTNSLVPLLLLAAYDLWSGASILDGTLCGVVGVVLASRGWIVPGALVAAASNLIIPDSVAGLVFASAASTALVVILPAVSMLADQAARVYTPVASLGFYIYYPSHLLILAAMQQGLFYAG